MKNKDPNNETSTYMNISYKSLDVSKKNKQKKKLYLRHLMGALGFPYSKLFNFVLLYILSGPV